MQSVRNRDRSPPPPLGMWMTSRGQCPRGGGARECPRVGVFFNLPELSVLLAVCTCGADVWWPGADLGGGGALPAFTAITIREGAGIFPVDLSVQTANT